LIFKVFEPLLASNELIINSSSRDREAAIFTLEMLQEAACELGKIIPKKGVPIIFALKRN
jgi:hypothetical protein